ASGWGSTDRARHNEKARSSRWSGLWRCSVQLRREAAGASRGGKGILATRKANATNATRRCAFGSRGERSFDGCGKWLLAVGVPEGDPLGGFGNAGNYTIDIEPVHVLAFVVTIRHGQHVHAGRPPRLGVVDGVADGYRLGGGDAQA